MLHTLANKYGLYKQCKDWETVFVVCLSKSDLNNPPLRPEDHRYLARRLSIIVFAVVFFSTYRITQGISMA